jgi:hypothetical protein
MPRSLKSNLAAIAEEQVKELGIKQLAFSIGIAEGTLRKQLSDNWIYVHRKEVEKICDHFGIGVDQLYKLVPDEFWAPFESLKTCTFLRGSTDPPQMRGHDIDAESEIQNVLQKLVQGVRCQKKEFDLERAAEIPRLAENDNCIVIGSPKSNPASEILLCQFFKARPFDCDPENARRVPFSFVWPSGAAPDGPSTLSAASVAMPADKPGLCWRDGGSLVGRMDFWPFDQFKARTIGKGRDCGVIFVTNKQISDGRKVKLIVLCGMSGIGTVGAARALTKNFKDLEPTPGLDYVLGVVQSWYNKPANQVHARKLKSIKWIVRVGGRAPISLSKDR